MTWPSCPTGFWRRRWHSKASIGPGKPTTAPGLRGSLVPAKQCSEHNPQGPQASAEQHQPGQDPHPHLDRCSPPAVGACTAVPQSAPALTETSELALKLHWRNKPLTCSKNSSMKRSRSTLTVTSSSSSLSFACNDTERGINKRFLQSLRLRFRSSSGASSPSPLLTCSQELGQTPARAWDAPGAAAPEHYGHQESRGRPAPAIKAQRKTPPQPAATPHGLPWQAQNKTTDTYAFTESWRGELYELFSATCEHKGSANSSDGKAQGMLQWENTRRAVECRTGGREQKIQQN